MSSLEPLQNYYDLLGVRPSASAEEIRRRYKFLVVAFHPDRFVRTPEHHAMAEVRIKQVNEAYRVLADPQARAQYDMLRIASMGGHVSGGGHTSATAPWFAQMQQELEYARTRIAQLEQEAGGWRARFDAAVGEKSALQRAQSERERQHQQAQQAMEAELGQITQQLEQLARERVALDRELREQAAQANQQNQELTQELASRKRLVETLAAGKAEWEKSTQTRYDLLTEQMRKLQEESRQREAALAEGRQAQASLQERQARSEQEARLAQLALADTLRSKQQEINVLVSEAQRATETRTREQRYVRLWQAVALIAVLNTLLLLALLMAR